MPTISVQQSLLSVPFVLCLLLASILSHALPLSQGSQNNVIAHDGGQKPPVGAVRSHRARLELIKKRDLLFPFSHPSLVLPTRKRFFNVRRKFEKKTPPFLRSGFPGDSSVFRSRFGYSFHIFPRCPVSAKTGVRYAGGYFRALQTPPCAVVYQFLC